jgi:predicted outer membrane repeat protein
MFDWIRRLFPRPSRAARRFVRTTIHPRLEALEDRIVPALAPLPFLIVTNTSSDPNVAGSLPNEVNQAQTGQTIVFAPTLNNQTITLSNQISLGQNGATNVSILGQDKDGSALTVTIDGGRTTRLFEVLPGISATINNLALINGYIWFSGNNANGAAALVDQNAQLNIANLGTVLISGNTSFANNSAPLNGGAIENLGVVSITGDSNKFTGNSAGQSGGATDSESSGTGGLDVENTTFADNTASGGDGGAIERPNQSHRLPEHS